MNEDNKAVFIKRLKSLLWRTGMMLVAILLKFALENIGLFELNPMIVGMIGLVLGEVSKYVNSQVQLAKALKAKARR